MNPRYGTRDTGQVLKDRQCFFGLMLCPETGSVLAKLDGGFENTSAGKYSFQFVGSDGGQTHRRDASTRRTIRIAPELAWRDLRPEIRRQRLRRQRENAI